MEKGAREFVEWKRQRDRELLQLKKQGRLNAAQLQKLEALHSKQQEVLRRKTGGWLLGWVRLGVQHAVFAPPSSQPWCLSSRQYDSSVALLLLPLLSF